VTAFADILRRRATDAIGGSAVTAAVEAGELDPWTGARMLAG
jgi:hypothetical protein